GGGRGRPRLAGGGGCRRFVLRPAPDEGGCPEAGTGEHGAAQGRAPAEPPVLSQPVVGGIHPSLPAGLLPAGRREDNRMNIQLQQLWYRRRRAQGTPVAA